MRLLIPLLLSAASLVFPFTVFALSGIVSGNWDINSSPITIDGDVTIASGNSLTIAPGVTLYFTGPYSLVVNGTLTAQGTSIQPITFTRATVTDGSKWGGIRFINADDSSLLEYCTIQYASRTTINDQDDLGGGVLIDDCSPTIRYCTIRNNHNTSVRGDGGGGAIAIIGDSTSLIESNLLTTNTSDSGGALCIGRDSAPVIRRNVISHNSANNSGGGIYLGAWARATIDGNIIRTNSAALWGGGGISLWNNSYDDGNCANVVNNIVYGNSTTASGGGIYSRYNTINLFNNTIFGNIAAVQGGGIFILNQGGNYPEMSNTIIRGNSGLVDSQLGLAEMILSDGTACTSEASLAFSNIEDGWSGAGSGNIDASPLFLNPAGGYFSLLPGSAGIDAGDNTVAETLDTDQAGSERILDGDADGFGVVDMGALEYDPAAPVPTDIDGSGSITLADTILLLQLLSGRDIGTSDDMTGIDINEDGQIGIVEAILSLQHIASQP